MFVVHCSTESKRFFLGAAALSSSRRHTPRELEGLSWYISNPESRFILANYLAKHRTFRDKAGNSCFICLKHKSPFPVYFFRYSRKISVGRGMKRESR